MYEPRTTNTRTIAIALIISRLIILIGVWFVFFRERTPTDTDTDGQPTYILGEQVLLEGTISSSENISNYSHILTDEEGKKFGLKSSEIVLNDYNGNVEIRGEVIGYKQALPIVEVAAIIGSPASGPTLPTTTGAGISPDDTYTYLPEYQLGIDLSTFPSATFEMLGNDLQIIDTASEKTLSINPFVCIANDPLKDCTVLKNNVTDTESFTTAAGATFSRFPESEKWFASHEKRGYRLTSQTPEVIQLYAGAIEFLAPEDLETHLESARLLCKDLQSTMKTIDLYDIQISNKGLITYTLDGSTIDGQKKATCIIEASASDVGTMMLRSYTTTATDTPPEKPVEPTKPVTPPSTVPTTGTTAPVAEVNFPENLSGWTAYPSVRGWTMYLSKNIVNYAGTLLTGGQQPGCPYQLDISYWKNGTGDASDTVIYECTPTGGATLQAAGYTRIGATTTVEFRRKNISETLKSLEIYIK